MPRFIGGSFAPPLTDASLAAYKSLAEALPATSPVRDAMLRLHACVSRWWDLPESTGGGRPHPVGRGFIVDLDKEIAASLWDSIPWGGGKDADGNPVPDELGEMARVFDVIPATPAASKALRDAAHHLLWFAKELNLDREPITNDKL